MELDHLLQQARQAANHSYSPYSHFKVGAALLCADGTVVQGANIENRSIGLTICAERSAMVAAMAQGQTTFKAIAIACPDADYPVSPCGACRQFLSEFVPADFPVVFAGATGGVVRTTMGELLPFDALHDLAKRL
jgi:cytidine deaminase